VAQLLLNLGGEGEIPGVLNQQGPSVVEPNWRSSRDGKTLQELVSLGHDFLIAPNDRLPISDNSVDRIYTNGVPIDVTTWLGLGVQTSEIQRILKSGGEWIRDGVPYFTKP
jgi:hypothetical protein